MSLAGAFDAYDTPKRGSICTIGEMLRTLGKDDAAALAAALDNRASYSGSAIERLLRAEGLAVGCGAANRHRRGECQCSATA